MSPSTILCVDDERNVLFTLRAQLSRHFPNHTIEIAESAAEALNLVDELSSQNIEIPLVIADQIMPGMRGDEFLIELHTRYPKILKVMLTGQARAEDVGNVVNRGSLYNFISKPWNETGLVLTVTEALRRYQQDQLLSEQQRALAQANQRLAALNIELEQQVQERTRQLQRNERQLRLFVEHAPAAVAMFDREMRYLLVSRRWEMDYHVDGQEILGRSHYDVFPNLPDRWRQAHQRGLAGVSESSQEDCFVNGEGALVWVQWEVHPWYTETDEIGGMILFTQMITDRKLAEQALQASEAELKKAQEIAHLGNWEYNVVTHQVYWSEEIYRIHGRDMNQPILTGEAAMQYIHPEDRVKYQQEILEKVAVGESFVCDMRIILADGSIRFIESRGEPLSDAHNQTIGFRGTVQDITDRKQTEAALRDSEERLRIALDAAHMGNWDWNIETDQIIWSENLERLMGLQRGEFDGRFETVIAMIYPDDRQPVLEAIRRSVEQGEEYDIEFRFVRPDGSIRWATSQGNVICDQSGRAVRMAGIDVDITDRKLAEITLQQALLSLQQTFQELAHHVENSPLATIRWNRDFRIESWSKQAEKIFGWSEEEVLGKAMCDWPFIHKDDWDHVNQVAAELFKGTNSVCDNRNYHKDGSILYCEWYNSILLDEQGNLVSILSLAQDMSARKKAELALQQSEANFREFATASPAIIFTLVFDAQRNSHFEYISPAVEEIYEISIADILQNRTLPLDQIHPADRGGHARAINRSLETMEPFQYEWRIITSSGKIKWLNGYSRSQQRPTGEIVWYGIVIDVSDRKQAEIALAEEIGRRRALFNTSIDGIVVLDQVGNIIEANASFAQMLGYSLEEMTTLNLIDFDVYWAGDAQDYRIDEHQLCESRFETCHRRKDGSTYDVEVSASALAWNDQTVQLYICRDITDRRRAELALHQLNEELEERVKQRTQELTRSEQDLRTIFNNVYDAILIHDINGTILDANDRALELRGATREQLLGATIADLSAPDAPLERLSEILRRVQDGETLRIEWREQRFDNHSIFDVEVSLKQVTLGNRPVFVAGVRDISDRKRYEAQLKQTNDELIHATRMKDDFLATMSHELRTPLNAILGMTESLQEEIFGEINDRQLKALQTIEFSSAHLLELINDILDFTKVGSSQMELVRTPTAVAPLCQSALALIKQQALKKQIHLHLHLPPDLPALYVDERRIRQVLLNLLNNAIKFTPEGGQITMEVSEGQKTAHAAQPNSLQISVIDTGIGIAPEHLDRLFQPFVQIDSALNRQYDGTGLGLALVKRIVELHGGQVGLTSEVGVGSCFRIELPCAASMSSPLLQEPQTLPPLPPEQPQPEISPLVLLAEDNEANITTIASYLTAKGYRMLIARNGQEAIALAQAEHPDIILMDIQMPKVDGIEATRQIRCDVNLIKVPIIALTGLAMPGDRDRCLQAGADLYLSKPVKLKQLSDTIQALLEE